MISSTSTANFSTSTSSSPTSGRSFSLSLVERLNSNSPPRINGDESSPWQMTREKYDFIRAYVAFILWKTPTIIICNLEVILGFRFDIQISFKNLKISQRASETNPQGLDYTSQGPALRPFAQMLGSLHWPGVGGFRVKGCTHINKENIVQINNDCYVRVIVSNLYDNGHWVPWKGGGHVKWSSNVEDFEISISNTMHQFDLLVIMWNPLIKQFALSGPNP